MVEQVELISPKAMRISKRNKAPRWNGRSGLIVLSDSMLNVNAGWGRLILDTVVSIFPAEGVTLERINRPQIGEHNPQGWIDELVEQQVSALIVTAGDCATCTSRALRECVLAEHAGIPATAVLPVALSEITHATLLAWGRPDLQVATFNTPLFALKQDDFPEVMRLTAEKARGIISTTQI